MTDIDPRDLDRLRARLADDAARDGLLDIAYRTMDSPFGPLLVATTERGIVRIAYANQDHDAVLAALAEQISPRVLRAPARLDDAAREIDEYLSGSRRGFDLPLDLQLAHGFRRGVLDELRRIDYGATRSYAAVAAAAGSPRAYRAVGTACALNPVPIVVPCHRVVQSGGGMGRYAGGESVKRVLLELEANAA